MKKNISLGKGKVIVLNWKKKCEEYFWNKRKKVDLNKTGCGFGTQIFYLYCYLIQDKGMSGDEAICAIKKQYGSQIQEKYQEFTDDFYKAIPNIVSNKYLERYEMLSKPIQVYETELKALREANIDFWIKRQLLVDLCVRKALGDKYHRRRSFLGQWIDACIKKVAMVPKKTILVDGNREEGNMALTNEVLLNGNGNEDESESEGDYNQFNDDIFDEESALYCLLGDDDDDGDNDNDYDEGEGEGEECEEDYGEEIDPQEVFFKQTRETNLVETIKDGDNYLFWDKEPKEEAVANVATIEDVRGLFDELLDRGVCRWCHREFKIPHQAKQRELCPMCSRQKRARNEKSRKKRKYQAQKKCKIVRK